MSRQLSGGEVSEIPQHVIAYFPSVGWVSGLDLTCGQCVFWPALSRIARDPVVRSVN